MVVGLKKDKEASWYLSGDDGDLGDGGLGVGVQKLGSVPDDAAVLLERAGKKSGHVLEGDDRNVEGVAEADEPRALDRSVDVEATWPRRDFLLVWCVV